MASTEAQETHRQWRERFAPLVLPFLLFMGVFSVYLATAERNGVNVDAYAASAGAWRLATAGTPWFDGLDVKKIDGATEDPNTTAKDPGLNRNGQWLLKSPNGHVAAQRMPGPILVGVPFYWLFGSSGTDESDFGLGPASVAASLVTASAVLVMFLTLRRFTRASLALTASLIFAFATPTWTVSANGLWTHPLTQLGVAGAALGASRGKWWVAGVFLGIGMLGRPHLALVAAILGLGLAWSRRDWRIIVGLAVPTTLALVLVAVWNRLVHGPWSLSGAYPDVMQRASQGVEKALGYDLLSNYAGFFVAFNRGFLVWTPVVLLFIPAVVRARRVLPDWSIWLVLGAVVYTFFQIRLADFTGGIFFYGYRHGLELVTALVPLLTLAAPFLGNTARRLVPVAVALQFATLSLGALLEGLFIPPEDVWRDNAFWHALVREPLLLGSWLALALGVGVVVALRYAPATPKAGTSTTSDEPNKKPTLPR